MRTLERIFTSEKEIRSIAESGASPQSRKRLRSGKHEDVDIASGSWFLNVLNNKAYLGAGPSVNTRCDHNVPYLPRVPAAVRNSMIKQARLPTDSNSY